MGDGEGIQSEDHGKDDRYPMLISEVGMRERDTLASHCMSTAQHQLP
jgi:hypothetical protein